MIKYLYESCTGNWYTTNKPLKDDELYCSTCGDTHSYLGEFIINQNLEKQIIDFIFLNKIYSPIPVIDELGELFNLEKELIILIKKKVRKKLYSKKYKEQKESDNE